MGSNLLKFGFNTTIRSAFLLIWFAALQSVSLYANEPDSFPKHTIISATYYRGIVYPHHEYIQFYNNEYINGLDFRVGQTFPSINSKRIPTIGFGGYISNLGNRDIYGSVFSGYVYFTSPIVMRKGFSVGTNVASGLGWVTKPNDPSTNSLNQAIGSHLNAFVMLALDFGVRINNNFTVFFGPSLTHNSNGKIRLPNTGLNILSFRLGADYLMATKNVDITQNLVLPDYDSPHRINFLLSGGIQQDNKQKPRSKGVWGLNTNYSYLLGKRGRAGAGVDLFYIPAEVKDFSESQDLVSIPSPWSGGVYLGYEIVWQKVSFVMQQGVRLFNETPNESVFYSRVGIRYRFAQRFVANCSLKTSRLVAEYVEWGIGYDLNL